jgi:hypothetical protein
MSSLDAEERRAAEEGLSEDEYALFCLLQKENISQADRGLTLHIMPYGAIHVPSQRV